MRRKSRKWLIGSAIALGMLGAVDVGIMASGHRILVHEELVQSGENYIVPGYGSLAKNGQASLVCRYFTGRSFTNDVLWYSSNNQMGRDQCPFIGKEVAVEEQAAANSSSPDWTNIAAVFLALLGYLTVEYHRRKEEKNKRQDSAYQIGYKLATLISEAITSDRSLYPPDTVFDDWKHTTDHFNIVRTQQPAVGFKSTMTRDLTDAEQNLLMRLREEDFLQDLSETFAVNDSIRQGMLEYNERYAAIEERKPVPDKTHGVRATFFLKPEKMRELHPYVVNASTLITKLREMSHENVAKLRRMGAAFHPMMNKHYPDLHLHKIEEALKPPIPLSRRPAFQIMQNNATITVMFD